MDNYNHASDSVQKQYYDTCEGNTKGMTYYCLCGAAAFTYRSRDRCQKRKEDLLNIRSSITSARDFFG